MKQYKVQFLHLDLIVSCEQGDYIHDYCLDDPQAAQTLFVIYIRDSIALCFEPCETLMESKPEKVQMALERL